MQSDRDEAVLLKQVGPPDRPNPAAAGSTTLVARMRAKRWNGRRPFIR